MIDGYSRGLVYENGMRTDIGRRARRQCVSYFFSEESGIRNTVLSYSRALDKEDCLLHVPIPSASTVKKPFQR